MHSKTKTKLLLVAFMLLSLGWARVGWSAIRYYEETATQLRKLPDELQRQYDSARTSPYGIFVQQHIAVIGGAYGLFALYLLLTPSYRNEGWNHLSSSCIVVVAFVLWFLVAFWISIAGREMRRTHGETLFTGLIHPLVTIALGLSVWIGIPLYLLFLLFTLPSVLFVILRFLVRLPVLTYHYLHYLSVPHPAETAYRAGMAEHLPIPELARTVADAMYRYDLKDFDGLPPAWKSQNYKKRIEAFNDLLKAQAGFLEERSTAWLEAEDRFMEELIKHLRMKSQFRE